MATKEKDKWRERWLHCINEITSLDLQKKSWLDNSHTNPHWSFKEFMCCYFDDLANDDNYKTQLEEGWVSKQEFEVIKPWHEKLNNYGSPSNDDFDHEAILNDPKWLEILEIGKIVKNNLARILSKKERKFLIEEIDYLEYI